MEINSDKSNELEKRYKNFNPKLNFVVVSQMLARDKRLSWKARGVFLYLATNNHKWTFHMSEIAQHSDKDGRTSTESAIKELLKYGYLKRRQCRKHGRFNNAHWELFYVPKDYADNNDTVNQKTVHGHNVNGKSVDGHSVHGKPTSNKYQGNKHQRNKYQSSLSTSNNSNSTATSKTRDELTEKQKRNQLYKNLNDKQRTLLSTIHKYFGTDTYNIGILKDVIDFSKYSNNAIDFCLGNAKNSFWNSDSIAIKASLRKNPFTGGNDDFPGMYTSLGIYDMTTNQ